MKGEESFNIANINLLVIFKKKQEIFFSVARVLSILLKGAATSAIDEKVNFIELMA